MDAEDVVAASDVRAVDRDLAVEPARRRRARQGSENLLLLAGAADLRDTQCFARAHCVLQGVKQRLAAQQWQPARCEHARAARPGAARAAPGARPGRAPARPQQGLVQDVRPVGAGQDDHARRGRKAVHLHQQLVQRVLALVVAARKAAAPARAPDRVDLICARTRLAERGLRPSRWTHVARRRSQQASPRPARTLHSRLRAGLAAGVPCLTTSAPWPDAEHAVKTRARENPPQIPYTGFARPPHR